MSISDIGLSKTDLVREFLVPRREQGATINVIQGVILGVFLTGLSYGLGIALGWIDTVSLLEAFAVFTSYVCTFLCVVERRINYPIGAVSTAAYCVLFYQYGLLASTAINAFLAVYLVYGWIRWKSDTDTRPVTNMSGLDWLLHLSVAAVGYGIIFALATAFGGTLAWTDSIIFVGIVLAQFMMDNKKFENWYVWLGVNGFAIYTYFAAGLTLVGFQYIFFFLNCFYALYMWNKSRNVVAPQPAAAPVADDTVTGITRREFLTARS
jgi:nicotinamide mononucleotide transporter